jgi:RNA polymerase sigma-B factor
MDLSSANVRPSAERPSVKSASNTPRSRTADPEAAAALLREYATSRDLELRNRIVEHHEGLVRYLAGRFAPRGATSMEDLVQVAYMGLIAAIERYDPNGGATFVTFAMPTIVGIIKHYLRDQTWSVKAPRRLRELAGKVRRLRGTVEQQLGREPTVAELAEAAGVTEERLLEAMEVDRLYLPASLDACMPDDQHDNGPLASEWMGEADPQYAAVEDREMVRTALKVLSAREQEIIRQRFFGEASQVEVARSLGISQMHVSRLERRALMRLRAVLS